MTWICCQMSFLIYLPKREACLLHKHKTYSVNLVQRRKRKNGYPHSTWKEETEIKQTTRSINDSLSQWEKRERERIKEVLPFILGRANYLLCMEEWGIIIILVLLSILYKVANYSSKVKVTSPGHKARRKKECSIWIQVSLTQKS